MPLPSFTITGTMRDLLGNIVSGEIVGNGFGGATPATVTFTSNVPINQFVHWSGDGSLDRVKEVVAVVNADGTITRDGLPVQLLANDAGLSVTDLQWQCHAAGMARFWFNAPTDGGTVNLGSVAPVPGIGVAGVTFSEGELVTLLSNAGSAVRAALDALYESAAAGSVTFAKLAPALVVTAAETIAANNNDTTIPTSAAVQAAIALAVTGLLDFKGATNASANPNYPAASKGDAYVVSTAGKVGGASGKSVDVGDVYFATADNAGGTQASVGTSWAVLEHNLVGALLSANNLSDIGSAATARANLGIPILKPEDFGAVGDGSTNDLTALNACFAAAAGKTVWLDPSKVYAHNDIVTIGQNGTIVTGGGTLKATNAAAQKSAVIASGDNQRLEWFALTCPTASVRRSTLEDSKLAITGDGQFVGSGVTIDGASNFGLVVYGATNFTVDTPTIKNTMADGYHTTNGAAHGRTPGVITENTGDDGVSVVSYVSDGAPCEDIRISGFKVTNSAARGISVVGGTDIRCFNGEVDGTVSAPIYVACEAGFATYGVSDVIVTNVDVANANSAAPTLDHGAVLVYNDRATGFDVDTVTITDIRVRDTDTGATHQVNLLNQSTGKMTGIDLGPMTFTGTGPSAILNTAGLLGPADVGFNGVADYVDNITPKSVQVKALDYVAGGSAEYRLLATLPIDDSGNVCSLSLAGRLGGWTSDAFAQWQILLSNRSAALDGVTVKAAVFGQGAIDNAVASVDIVVYAHVDKSASVYIKHPVGGFYAYDFDVRGVRTTIGYDGVKSTSVPTGTLIWSLSTAPKLTMDTAGVVRAPSSIELGNASDTTLARSSAGNLTVEGNALYRAGGTDVPITDGGTGVSTLPTGLLKGAGTGAITAATAGTDYLTPTGSAASLTSFPTFNQNTTGSAAKWTTARTVDGQSLDGTANITVIAPGTHAATGKTAPVDADELALVDSAASNVLKKLTVANLAAAVAPNEFEPVDQGLIAWSFDPAMIANSVSPGAGFMVVAKVPVRRATTITNIVLNFQVAGSGLTSGRNFAALYNSAGTLLSATADQTTAWGTNGIKTMALTTPQAVAAQVLYVGYFANGTTPPTIFTSSAAPEYNATIGRAGYDNVHTGLTTAPPGTLGTLTAYNLIWAAVS